MQKYIAGLDSEYARKPIARNFYNKNGYANRYSHEAAVYIVTGDDALELDSLGREIGMARAQGNIRAVEKATSKYWAKGSELVATKSKNFVMPSGEEAELHVKVETLRDRDGEKKSYNILDMRCFPKEGPNNPFALINWMKS